MTAGLIAPTLVAPQSTSRGAHHESRRRITVPTLILTGDRDQFCSVEEGVTAYRMLQDGELAVLPNTGHLITPAVIQTTIEFFQRRATNLPGSPSTSD
jgi:pimeloyl-ACP methyl ester carboxylesterase